MEPNESGLTSYYHHHNHQHHQQQPPQNHQPPQPQNHQNNSAAVVVSASPTNGILPNTAPMVYPHATVTPPVETVKRKRGRPRKYGTPEAAAEAKRAMAALVSPPKKKEHQIGGCGASSSSSFAKKNHAGSLGNAGLNFTPHIVSVASGEDVYQKIMLFMQQSRHEMCILSASGSVFNPSLLQPAAAGGQIAYEGLFNIVSLSGSYIRTELGGKSGGMSICLSSDDGQMVGGAIGGPLRAAGPVQVIVATFIFDPKKNDPRGDNFNGN